MRLLGCALWVLRLALDTGGARLGDVAVDWTVVIESLTDLPCWADMPAQQWRTLVWDIIEDIERKADAERETNGSEALGVQAVLAADSEDRLTLLGSLARIVGRSSRFPRGRATTSNCLLTYFFVETSSTFTPADASISASWKRMSSHCPLP